MLGESIGDLLAIPFTQMKENTNGSDARILQLRGPALHSKNPALQAIIDVKIIACHWAGYTPYDNTIYGIWSLPYTVSPALVIIIR